MQTQMTEAKRGRELEVPKAQAEASQMMREAQGYATELLAKARGDAAMWLDLYREYRQNPRVVRDRLYFEGIEAAMAIAPRRFVPPPVNGRSYGEDSFRISISGAN
jgi:membrane protease subunit HflK